MCRSVRGFIHPIMFPFSSALLPHRDDSELIRIKIHSHENRVSTRVPREILESITLILHDSRGPVSVTPESTNPMSCTSLESLP